MRFSPALRLLAVLALFGALLTVDVTAAPAAPSSTHRAKSAALSDRVNLRRNATNARKKRKLRRAVTRDRSDVSDAVGLTRPRPQPAARPATPPSDLIFDGSRIASFGHLQAAEGAITEVSDPAGSGETVFEMNVEEDDVYPVTPTENPRAQALSPPIIRPGDEFWLQTKFMLPQNLPTVDGWMSLVAIYGAPFEGPGPWEIEVAGDEIHWMRNGTYDWDVPWRMPLVEGRWVTVLLHERFASDGWVEMWIDGQQVSFFGREQRLQMQTMDASNNGAVNEAKIMQYREAGMFDSASVYFGALKVGKTRASVGG